MWCCVTRRETLISKLNLIIAATRKVRLLARYLARRGRLSICTRSRSLKEVILPLCVNLPISANPPQNERVFVLLWLIYGSQASTFALNCIFRNEPGLNFGRGHLVPNCDHDQNELDVRPRWFWVGGCQCLNWFVVAFFFANTNKIAAHNTHTSTHSRDCFPMVVLLKLCVWVHLPVRHLFCIDSTNSGRSGTFSCHAIQSDVLCESIPIMTSVL